MNAMQPTFGGEIKRSEQINELAKALSKAQGMFTGVERGHTAKVQTKDGGGYAFDFADLAANLDVVRKPLAECGLSYTQWPVQVNGTVGVATLLMHESGQWIEYPPLALHAADTRPQTTGSAITYARRYQLAPVLGLAAETDDDGNAASGNQAAIEPRKQQPKPSCPKCNKTEFVFANKDKPGFFCWLNKDKGKLGCGHKWGGPADAEESGEKPNGKAKEDGPPPGTGAVDMSQAIKSLEEATPGKRKVWRERILARYGQGDVSVDDMAMLALKASTRFEDDDEAALISKWLHDLANLGNEHKFDPAANALQKARAELAAA